MSTPALVGPDGRPVPRPRHASTACPRCRADEGKRVKSSGFGTPHEVCSECGHEFKEGA